MNELKLNREKFNATVDKLISHIKERRVKCVNFELDWNGLFEDQIYHLNAVDFIDGLTKEEDDYSCVPMYTRDHLSGIFMECPYEEDAEMLPSFEIEFTKDQLEVISREILKRKEEFLDELGNYIETKDFDDIEDGVLSFLSEDTLITGYFRNRNDYCIFINKSDQDIIITNKPGKPDEKTFKFDDPEVDHWMTLWSGLYSAHLRNKVAE